MNRYIAFTVALTFGVQSCVGLCQGPVLDASTQTRTPIKHVVVIFDENISFDHYFGTYPFAPNPPGEPKFLAKLGTPAVNGFTD